MNQGHTKIRKVSLIYSKISGLIVKFAGQQRISTGVQYLSKEIRLSDHMLVIRTFENGRKLVTEMLLSGPELLDFESKSDDPRIPIIKGRFFSADYEDCVLRATLAEQNLAVSGIVTKLV